MVTTDESQPSILTAPLLPSTSASTSISGAVSSSGAVSDDDDQFPPISFNHGRRPIRDIPALILFLLLSLATLSLGIVALIRRNPSFSHSHSFVFDPISSSCVPSRRLSNSFLLSGSPIFKDLLVVLILTFLLSLPIVLFLLWLLKHFAKQVIYACIPFFIIIPTFLNVYWFVSCTVSSSCRSGFPLAYRVLVLVFVFLLVMIILWIIVANWNRVELTVHIVRVAADALFHNLALLLVLPGLTLAFLVYVGLVSVFLVFARFNGSIEPTVGADGEYYCEWRQEGWVPAYFALAIVTLVWTAASMVEAQVFVISGTIAQWYFCKEGVKPRRSIRTSLRNAFGPSFGTVCFSGMIMGAVRIIRVIVDSAKREGIAPGIVNFITQCCAKVLLSACDFVNKFTVIFTAITGEGYCSSAKMTYELLKRNLLSAVFVETVSTRVLVGIIFVLSTLYAIVVCAILKAVSDLNGEIYLVALFAWLLLIILFGFFVHVLDNVIDTVYVCYAIDRDKGEVCKQDVHEVYVQLPLSRNHRPTLNPRSTLLV
ncbi:Choline transporter-like protein [Dioscorea alata]|uniref:Choline transporter-like protein n=1 Tax=Dioscorea alata TaxID=55571 RepID=A0ACB7TZ07_DIOAL|nr:Choline transporter-like protein [Dioscorea alata]